MADFKVDTEQISSVAQQLEGWTDDYASCVNRIYQVAQNLQGSWIFEIKAMLRYGIL